MIALLVNPNNPNAERIIRDVREAARDKRLQFRILKAGTEGEIDGAFASLVELRAGALVVGADPFFSSRGDQLVALASRACSARRPTADLSAYDRYLRAYAMVMSSARQTSAALRLLEQAIERDPRYGPALAYAALCCNRLLPLSHLYGHYGLVRLTARGRSEPWAKA